VPYVTQQQLIDRFGEAEMVQLTDRHDLGVIDGVVLDLAIADADAEIDGYLKAGGYTPPLSPAPPVISRLSAAITRYHLYSDQATEKVRQDYEDARRMCEAIAAGRMSLGAEDAVTASPGRVVMRGGVSNIDWDTH
jgi:phage gp36-like protein